MNEHRNPSGVKFITPPIGVGGEKLGIVKSIFNQKPQS